MRETYHTQLHIHSWANLVNEDKYMDRNGTQLLLRILWNEAYNLHIYQKYIFHTNEKRKFEFMLVIDR